MTWKPLILLLSLATAALAVEDPANCDLSHGGLGNTSVGGLNFSLSQAHVGDSVSVTPKFGMVATACSADSVTGSVYISTGFLTNFMVNVHLYPTGVVTCPGDAACTPGPYSFTITAPMVGAGVTSPNGNVSGASKLVRSVENAVGTVNTIVGYALSDFHSASITIVTPCIQVFKVCGTNCYGSNVWFSGYVTNCGDITLTNVTVVDDRTTNIYKLDNSALTQPFTMTNGQVVSFKGTFAPFVGETATATNTITVRGTDTTAIGGPNASVTNSVTAICYVKACPNCPCPCFSWYEPVRPKRYPIGRGMFHPLYGVLGWPEAFERYAMR